MRRKSRIKPFLEKFEEIWLQHPDFRFGQMVSWLNRDSPLDPFYFEEKDWLKLIEEKLNKD